MSVPLVLKRHTLSKVAYISIFTQVWNVQGAHVSLIFIKYFIVTLLYVIFRYDVTSVLTIYKNTAIYMPKSFIIWDLFGFELRYSTEGNILDKFNLKLNIN